MERTQEPNVLTRIPPVSEMTPEELAAYKAMLRRLQSQGFYEPKMDNPEGVVFENEEQTMQPDPTNLKRVLSGKARQEQLDEILRQR